MSKNNCLKITVCMLLIAMMSIGVVYAGDRQSRKRRKEVAKEMVKEANTAMDSLRSSDVLPRRDVLQDSSSFMLRRPGTDSLLLRGAGADSLSLQDSLSSVSDSLKKKNQTLEYPAFSVARDSMIEDFSGGKRMIYYYGEIKVDYGNMSMTADYMKYDLDANVVYACGVPDSNGVVHGRPKMTENGVTYEMEDVYYNFTTRKSKIRNMITSQQDGILHGKDIKMMPDNSFNIKGGKYTTCDCEHPHFYLQLSAARVVTKPKQMTVFGPAVAYLEDVPTPFALPFGFVPKMATRASGILIPSYGEETSRGFFLKGLGYYFVLGEHWDIALTGDIYSLGSWAVQLTSRYKKRYKFNGDFNLSYSNDQTGEKGSPDFFQSKNFSLKWNHAQDPKALPGASFRASVNFTSPSYNKYNSETSINDHLQNQISSSISFSKSWAGTPFTLSVNMLHSQSSRDSSYSFTLPNITLSMNRIYPFKKKQRAGKEKFYETISLGYNATIDNKINFKASEFGKPGFWDKMQNGVKHSFSINLPSFSLLKYLQFSPTVSYGMNWYFQTTTKEYNYETGQVESQKSKQFSTFGVTQDFSAGISMSTRIYGMFNFGKRSAVQAIRHMVSPSISFNYRPNLATPVNGYTSTSYIDNYGVHQVVEYNKYEGMLYAPPGTGQTAGLSFSLGNNFEAKVRDRKDTTGTGVKKIKLIDQLSFSGSYNFLADSMKLSNIGISLSTTIFQKLGLNGNITLDPYAVNERGVRYNKFNIVQEGGFKLFRMTNASLSLSYRFQGESKSGGASGAAGASQAGQMGQQGASGAPQGSASQSMYERIYYHPVTGEYIPGGWVYYLDPDIPWSVDLNYSYSYRREYNYANEKLNTKHNHTQTLGVSAQLRLTRDLNLSVNTGLDMTKFQLTTTQLSATYDLHCFQISFSWVPMGQWQSWSFRINAKASALADLLQYRKGSSFWDNRY